MATLRRRDLLLALLATLAILLAGAAATPLFQVEHGADSPPEIEKPRPDALTDPGDRTEVPIELIMATVIVLAAIAIVVQFVSDPAKTFQQILAVSIFLGVLFVFLEILSRYLPDPQLQPESSNQTPLTPTPVEANMTGFGDGETNPLSLPAGEIAGIVLVAGLLGIVVLFAWRSETVRAVLDGQTEAEQGNPNEGLGEVGDIAGEAADNVEAAMTARAADNAIYSAWREMVDLLDAPDPQSGTPQQFASAAIEAGMNSDDVTVLTETFEEVRYGDAPLSTERRERAVNALRRIERTHGQGTADMETTSTAPGRPEDGSLDHDGNHPGGFG